MCALTIDVNTLNEIIVQYEQKKQTITIEYKNLEPYKNKVLSLGALIDVFYPVGSIYTNMNNINPSQLFGGAWVGTTSSVPGSFAWKRMA